MTEHAANAHSKADSNSACAFDDQDTNNHANDGDKHTNCDNFSFVKIIPTIHCTPQPANPCPLPLLCSLNTTSVCPMIACNTQNHSQILGALQQLSNTITNSRTQTRRKNISPT